MKKLLTLCALALLLSANAVFAEPTAARTSTPIMTTKVKPAAIDISAKRESMYTKLSLDEKQRAEARALKARQDQQTIPVMRQISVKKQEISNVKQANLSQAEKDKKIAACEKEIKALRNDVSKISKSGQKEFEAILTKDQKALYKEMQVSNTKCCSNCKCKNCPDLCEKNCPCRKGAKGKGCKCICKNPEKR